MTAIIIPSSRSTVHATSHAEADVERTPFLAFEWQSMMKKDYTMQSV
jgi:hypothetical protein